MLFEEVEGTATDYIGWSFQAWCTSYPSPLHQCLYLGRILSSLKKESPFGSWLLTVVGFVCLRGMENRTHSSGPRGSVDFLIFSNSYPNFWPGAFCGRIPLVSITQPPQISVGNNLRRTSALLCLLLSAGLSLSITLARAVSLAWFWWCFDLGRNQSFWANFYWKVCQGYECWNWFALWVRSQHNALLLWCSSSPEVPNKFAFLFTTFRVPHSLSVV